MKGEELISEKATSQGSEFYTPIPQEYKKGKTKYIFVAGTVMSGIGKGIFASSLAMLLKDSGLKISPIKFDGYLNIDAGTLNPYRHGEVFVLEDGLECDMDLGSYERFLDQNLNKINYMTAGMIFESVLKKERKGEYLGRDVQFIPHVTGEIKSRLRNLAMQTNADIVLLEIGGTVGDIENSYLIEAVRQFMYEEGRENVCFINLVYIVQPPNLGEQKSKPAQLGLNKLMSLGIQPDIVVCRAVNPVEQKIKEKISVYSNVPVENVIGLHNTETVFEVPLVLDQAKVDEKVIQLLGLKKKVNPSEKKKKLIEWNTFTEKNKHPKKEVTIGIAGKYTGLNDSYASILKALEHAGTHLDTKVKVKFIESTEIEDEKKKTEEELKNLQGLIVPGGFGARGTKGKIECIKFAREKNLPFLGICYGFQMALIEFARNKCNLKNANSTEIDPNTSEPVIDILPEQKKIEGLGGNMRLGEREVEIKPGTKAAKLYKAIKTKERFRHRFECNPKYIQMFEEKGIEFSGKAPKVPIMQIFELNSNDFFVGIQFHPEFTSRPLKPNPLFYGLVESAIKKV